MKNFLKSVAILSVQCSLLYEHNQWGYSGWSNSLGKPSFFFFIHLVSGPVSKCLYISCPDLVWFRLGRCPNEWRCNFATTSSWLKVKQPLWSRDVPNTWWLSRPLLSIITQRWQTAFKIIRRSLPLSFHSPLLKMFSSLLGKHRPWTSSAVADGLALPSLKTGFNKYQ